MTTRAWCVGVLVALSTFSAHNAGVAILSPWGTGPSASPARLRPAAVVTRPAVSVAPTRPAALAFVGVTVIDVQDGRRHPDQTVVISGTRITAVGRAPRVRLPAGAQVIDARGQYLLPGLWDMELVLGTFSKPLMQLLLANGVTGFRHLGLNGGGVIGGNFTTLDSLRRWRQEVATGARIGPRLLIGSPRLDGCVDAAQRDASNNAWEIHPCTLARARALVDSIQAAGADHIFVYNNAPMRRAVAFAILARARQRHIPVVGHLPDSLSLREAADRGMRAVDHGQMLPHIAPSCFNWPPSPNPDSPFPRRDSTSEAQCRALAARLRRTGTWVVLGPFWGSRPARLTDTELRRRLQFLPPQMHDSVLESWNPLVDHQDQVPRDFLAPAERAGLPILFGSDGGAVPNLLPPGFELHNDLAVAVEHGLTPLTALQAATVNAARYLGGTDSLGTIAKGKLADLVLLDGDPLVDIYNTQRIRAVVANGRYYDRAALDALLAAGARDSVPR